MTADALARRRAYQQAVRALGSQAATMRAAGHGDEAIARALVQRRNALKVEFRADDDPRIVTLIEARNRARYGDPIGPDAEYLFVKYGNWASVIAAACRPASLVIE